MNKKALIKSLLFVSTFTLVACNNKPAQKSDSSETQQTTNDQQTTNTPNTSSEQTSEIDPNFELVKSTLDVDNDCEAGKLEDDFVKGPFTIVKGTEIRNRTKPWTDPKTGESKSFNKSIKIGNADSKLKVKVNGTGTLSIWVQNGSSGVATRTVTFEGPTGTKEVKIPGTEVSLDLPDYASGSPVAKVTIEVSEGTYTINRDSGTIDIYYAELEVLSEKSELVGFEIASTGTTEYVEGQTYSSSQVKLNAVYGNGKTEAISITDSDVVVDSTNVDMSKKGVYKVSVKYKDFAAQEFDVKVYEVKNITLGFNKIVEGANSSAGNKQYINKTVKQVYKQGEALNHDNLTVIANCSDPSDETKAKSFIMDEKYLEVTSTTFNSNQSGTYEVKVALNINSKQITNTYNVHVVTTPASVVEETIQVKVDASYVGEIGSVVENKNMFATVQQALDFLNGLDASQKSMNKVLTLASGKYTEKLEITVPNLTIVGEDKENTIIEWDSLYGIKDESGYEHTTDSTASVNVRDTAINCVMKNITISNWFNCEEHFDERFGANYAEHRALALLVQADQFTMDNCKLLGYQDTVEFFTGRQLIKNTYIEGTTDFIFGTNNTTYFYNCEIHCIYNAKGNGGYITAFKGCNKGASDAIKYGAIFDQCNFTADSRIESLKKTSIGRCWGAYAAVMVMNSTLGGHITTKGSTGNTKDERYVAMNAKPTDSTVQFTEYNNTGAGALTEAVAGMKLLTEEEASAYSTLSTIFGTTNGKLTYASAWEVTL